MVVLNRMCMTFFAEKRECPVNMVCRRGALADPPETS